jgi:hypothetical protein
MPQISHNTINSHCHLVFISVFLLQATYLPNMAENSTAQYEVVAMDDEDGVQWRQWWGRLMEAVAIDGIED